jgi:fatty-acyl-CoA synthase
MGGRASRMEISAWISHWGCWTPARIALRFEGREFAYGQLESGVGSLASQLRDRGIGSGHRVAYLGPNCPELLQVLFASSRVGACFVPLNARMPAPELSVFVGQARPSVVVTSVDLKETALAAFRDDESGVLDFTPGRLVAPAVNAEPLRPENTPEIGAAAPALILFTSGTTGVPKGAVITQGGLQANAASTVATLRMTSKDRVLTYLPMFHLAGLNLLTLPALSVGAEVTVHRQFDPAQVLEEIRRLCSTLLVVPPPLSLALSSHPRWADTDLSSIRAVMTGGTTVGARAVDVWSLRGIPVIQGYGLTETGGNATATPLDDAPAKSMAAGKPTVGFQVRIASSGGSEGSSGGSGEILVRGPSVMSGYFENAEASRTAMPDGWLRTGDLGLIDEDGYLHVLDRLREIIIVGVSNVYPGDLEVILEGAPDIAEAAIVGIPDTAEGEIPVAFVVPAQASTIGPEDVLALFNGRTAPYKQPRKVFIVDSLPRTSVGKVERKALKAMAIAAQEASATNR